MEGIACRGASSISNSNRVANALLSARFQIGDCVGFLGKNTRFFAIALLGVSKAGVTFMPLNWRLAAAELAVILRDSECKLMFVESEFLALAADALQGADLKLQIVRYSSRGSSSQHGSIQLARRSRPVRLNPSSPAGFQSGPTKQPQRSSGTSQCSRRIGAPKRNIRKPDPNRDSPSGWSAIGGSDS